MADERCVLCLGEKCSPVYIKCGHSFCYECLNAHKSYQNYAWANKCPICRHNLNEQIPEEDNTSIESADYDNLELDSSLDQTTQESRIEDENNYFSADYEEDTSYYYDDEDEPSMSTVNATNTSIESADYDNVELDSSLDQTTQESRIEDENNYFSDDFEEDTSHYYDNEDVQSMSTLSTVTATMSTVNVSNTSIESADYDNVELDSSPDQTTQISRTDDENSYISTDNEEDAAHYYDEDDQSYDQQENPSTLSTVTAANTSIESDDYDNVQLDSGLYQTTHVSRIDNENSYISTDYEEDTSHYYDDDEQSFDQQDSIYLDDIGEEYYFHEDATDYDQEVSLNHNFDDSS